MTTVRIAFLHREGARRWHVARRSPRRKLPVMSHTELIHTARARDRHNASQLGVIDRRARVTRRDFGQREVATHKTRLPPRRLRQAGSNGIVSASGYRDRTRIAVALSETFPVLGSRVSVPDQTRPRSDSGPSLGRLKSNVLAVDATARGFETRRYRAWLGSMVSMTRSGRRAGCSWSRHREMRVTNWTTSLPRGALLRREGPCKNHRQVPLLRPSSRSPSEPCQNHQRSSRPRSSARACSLCG